VLLVVTRLGLRASEVAGLQLDDVDWRAGEITVRGKGQRQEKLPLPPDVGRAMAEYVRRDRPRVPARALFLRRFAPLTGFGRGLVSALVRQACVRAGIPQFGAHRLRHTLATEMLRRGASLSSIAQVLRHRSVQSTAIYAKVDRSALRALAQPWPGGEP
jgi:integrase